MNKFVIAIVIAIISTINLHSQSFDNYVNITSEGTLPIDVIRLSSEKYLADKTQIDKKNTTTLERKAQDVFYQSSNYQLNELLHSGLILFDNELTKYVNKVADHAFVAYPELRGKLKIYVARSTAVNAFTFDNGTIIVNVGLLANLDNEAQLAFILCHELTHYKDKHVIEGFVENVKIEKKASITGSRNNETRLLQKSKFSKQQEFAADAQGLEMFYKTQYDKKVPLQCFEILRDYITPFKQIREFTTKFFNPYTSVASDTIKLDSLYFFDFDKGDDDTDDDGRFATHPHIDARIMEIHSSLEEMSASTKPEDNKLFIETESDFNRIRNVARFEMCKLYIQNREFSESFYATYNLQKEFPDNKYLSRCMIRSLYGLAKYKNSDQISEVVKKPKKTTQPLQTICNYFREVDAEEFNFTALAMAYNQYNKDTTDEEMKSIVRQLIYQYVKYHDKEGVFLRKATNKFEKFSTKDSVYFKRYSYNTIQKYFDDKWFTKRYQLAYDKVNEPDEVLTASQKKLKTKKRNYEDKHGLSLGKDSIMIIDPTYLQFDLRNRSNPLHLQASESNLLEYYNTIRDISKKVDLKTQIITPYELNAQDIEKFNTLMTLKDVMREYEKNDDVFLIPFDYSAIEGIRKKYNINYIADMGVLSARLKKPSEKYFTSCVAMLCYPLIPFLVYGLAKPEYETYNFILLYDLENFEQKTILHRMNNKDKISVTSSALYFNFLQIKRESKY